MHIICYNRRFDPHRSINKITAPEGGIMERMRGIVLLRFSLASVTRLLFSRRGHYRFLALKQPSPVVGKSSFKSFFLLQPPFGGSIPTAP